MAQVIQGDHAAGGVGGRVQHDHFRAVRDFPVKHFQVEGKVVLLTQWDGDRHATGHPDHGFVGGKAGIGVDDLVSGTDQRQGGEKQPRFGAGPDDHPRWLDIQAEAFRDIICYGPAQSRRPGRGCIACLPVLNGADAGLADIGKGGKIRLADFQVQDLAALGFKFIGTRQHGVGAFGFKRVDSVGEHFMNPYRSVVFGVIW